MLSILTPLYVNINLTGYLDNTFIFIKLGFVHDFLNMKIDMEKSKASLFFALTSDFIFPKVYSTFFFIHKVWYFSKGVS